MLSHMDAQKLALALDSLKHDLEERLDRINNNIRLMEMEKQCREQWEEEYRDGSPSLSGRSTPPPDYHTLPGRIEDEADIFPWKYPVILTFRIPLTDGLGVIVDGRSTLTANGSMDLGIFIQAVIPGGAASKDGQLQTNDRLVYIDGISLRRMSNSRAMETLGAAMTKSAVFLGVERITGMVREHCQLPRGGVERAQGPGMQKKQRFRDEATESLLRQYRVFLTLTSLLLVFIFFYVIYISKNVFAHHIGLYL